MRGDMEAHLAKVIRQSFTDRMPYCGRRTSDRRMRAKQDRWTLRVHVASLRALRAYLPRETAEAIRDALDAAQGQNGVTDNPDPLIWSRTIQAFDAAYRM